MKVAFHRLVSKVLKRNLAAAPKELILDQMKEPRPLPMGRQDFEQWSDRIISGAIIPGGEEDPAAFKDSVKFALAEMIMHLGKTESHKEDAFFIHTLRKGAANQVAHMMMKELKAKHEERSQAKKLAEEEAAKKASSEEPKVEQG